MKLIALLVSLCCSAIGQPQTTGKAETRGACSPASTGNNNIFNITCQGISGKLGVQLVDLLNRVSKNQIDAEAIMKKLDGCLSAIVDRRLTDQQRASLLAALAQFHGHKVDIESVLGDKESKRYGLDFVEVFQAARWTSAGLSEGVFDIDPIGVIVRISKADIDKNIVPPDAGIVSRALTAAGIPWSGENNSRIAEGELQLLVGTKPAAK